MQLSWQLVIQGALGSLIAGTIVALLFRFTDWRTSIWSSRSKRNRLAREKPKRLQHYLESLAKRTLQINHPWMKEGQSLGDILVPVNVMVGSNRLDLHQYITNLFGAENSVRALLLGSPGSGKSIAMGDIARFVPKLKRPITPIMVTFTDIKGAETREDIERVATNKLQRDQFTDSRPDAHAQPTMWPSISTKVTFSCCSTGMMNWTESNGANPLDLLSNFLQLTRTFQRFWHLERRYTSARCHSLQLSIPKWKWRHSAHWQFQGSFPNGSSAKASPRRNS